jgi:antibiotic biosynthesis monooxygenase (ABM) superfamily enzyme
MPTLWCMALRQVELEPLDTEVMAELAEESGIVIILTWAVMPGLVRILRPWLKDRS